MTSVLSVWAAKDPGLGRTSALILKSRPLSSPSVAELFGSSALSPGYRTWHLGSLCRLVGIRVNAWTYDCLFGAIHCSWPKRYVHSITIAIGTSAVSAELMDYSKAICTEPITNLIHFPLQGTFGRT
jgi:hypothetical protein